MGPAPSEPPSLAGLRVHALIACCRAQDVDASEYAETVALPDGAQVVTEWSQADRAAVTRALRPLLGPNGAVTWHRVRRADCEAVIAGLEAGSVLLNLVDGTEPDGWTGLSVIEAARAWGLAWTGADADFFGLDGCKPAIKRRLLEAGVGTPAFVDLPAGCDVREELLAPLRPPLLVKPARQCASVGLSERSVAHSAREAAARAQEAQAQWGDVLVEEFIAGREFTVLVRGSAATGIRCAPAMELVFSEELPVHERFLTYHKKWVDWGRCRGDGRSWWHEPAPADLQESLQSAARAAYAAVAGTGYARLDLRLGADGVAYFVDVNANCAVETDPDQTFSLSLRAAGLTLTDFLEEALRFALRRAGPRP